jgi:endonuclease/exonuclease/phosphatase family metal-dependent hydrolase
VNNCRISRVVQAAHRHQNRRLRHLLQTRSSEPDRAHDRRVQPTQRADVGPRQRRHHREILPEKQPRQRIRHRHDTSFVQSQETRRQTGPDSTVTHRGRPYRLRQKVSPTGRSERSPHFACRNNYLPVIVTGDLNSTPDSAVYKFITTGRLKYEELSPRSLQNGTAGPKTGKNFLPTSLRITGESSPLSQEVDHRFDRYADQCQHADLLPKREKNGSIPRSEELKLIELKHSERQQEDAKNRTANKNEKKLFASGTLSHKFSLQSVYKHQMNGDVEGTTFQDKWVSVDYIFFRYCRKCVKMQELSDEFLAKDNRTWTT